MHYTHPEYHIQPTALHVRIGIGIVILPWGEALRRSAPYISLENFLPSLPDQKNYSTSKKYSLLKAKTFFCNQYFFDPTDLFIFWPGFFPWSLTRLWALHCWFQDMMGTRICTSVPENWRQPTRPKVWLWTFGLATGLWWIIHFAKSICFFEDVCDFPS